jgi:hypothetical protein
MSAKIRPGQYLLVRGKLAKMLTAFAKIEELYERDHKKWTRLQQWSTIDFLNNEVKNGIFDQVMKLYREQFGNKVTR